ncbi:ORF34 [Bovine gammaherpesvirus 6]|uniref:ORF34 n=1 Tax=Bovine gammaherpesvirus 6 TaxID=1504288 RepID=A0A060CU12_9GAMA|nr:ORF34 [Bovine gammaherpesvirus 6]AIB03187.1 ORF34 [Bovine gammaherpesvirus 6]
MLNLAKLHCDGDPELTRKYRKGVELALKLAESAPGQFKLIESPVNSFLIVANLLAEETRPWGSVVEQDGLDFSSVSMPRLETLDRLVQYAPKAKRRQKVTAGNNEHCMEAYIAYDFQDWIRALSLNKDELINEALELLSSPKNWSFCCPTDPLPWLWLLFQGPLSHCEEVHCIYYKFLNKPGPVLFPPVLYQPKAGIMSFMSHVCKYVKHLYGEADVKKYAQHIYVPFDPERLIQVSSGINEFPPGQVFCQKSCLLCLLHRQNLTSFHSASEKARGCIILKGAEQHINNSVGRTRCLDTGDTILWPAYNIESLINYLSKNDTKDSH